MKVFDHLQILFQNELYEEVQFVYELMPHNDVAPPKSEALMHVYLADSYAHTDKHTLAKKAYYKALGQYANLTRPVTAKGFTESDVRFRLHQCLLKLNKRQEAVGVLSKIPENAATPKVTYALAKLHMTNDRQHTNKSLAYLQDVCVACPSALFSLSSIVRAGMTPRDAAASLARQQTTGPLRTWLEAQEMVGHKHVIKAAMLLANAGVNNYRFLVELGYLYNSLGMREEASAELFKAFSIDSEQTEGMDLLAALLAKESKVKTLESVATSLMADNEDSVEAWIAYGYLARAQNKGQKALYFAQRACTMGPSIPRVDAMLLKALVLIDAEKCTEASSHLLEAISVDCHNIELYETLAGIHVAADKLPEADAVAKQCLEQNPGHPRALVLQANVLLKSPDADVDNKAMKLLEGLVRDHPYYTEAVFLLVEALTEQHKYDKAIELLKGITENVTLQCASRGRLNHLLGDLLHKAQQPESAYMAYNQALAAGAEGAAGRLNALEAPLGCVTPQLNVPPPLNAPRRRRHADTRDAFPGAGRLTFS